MTDEASKAKIREMYKEIKSGRYDKKSEGAVSQTITVDGKDTNLSLAKDRPGWQRYKPNIEEVQETVQPILDAWLEYCYQHRISNPEIRVTSGYRTTGNPKSAHRIGSAVD